MKNQVQFVVDEVNRPPERPLTILMTSTHPMTDANLCKTGHQFFNLDIKQFPIKWGKRPVPENMTIINDISALPHRPDIILSQNVVDQLPVFQRLGYTFDAPVIEFEHTLPSPQWQQNNVVAQIRKEVIMPAYVFITDFSKREWLRENDPNAFTIYHMVDTDFYKGWTGGNGKAAMMCNSFLGREWAVGDVAGIMDLGYGTIKLFGNNPGYDSITLPTPTEVVRTLSEFDVFVNASLRSPIPASLLEAASIGMPIVTTKTCAIPDFFSEGENARFFETNEECIAIVKELLADKKERKRLGKAARQTVIENFNEERYKADWDNVLSYALGVYHHG